MVAMGAGSRDATHLCSLSVKRGIKLETVFETVLVETGHCIS